MARSTAAGQPWSVRATEGDLGKCARKLAGRGLCHEIDGIYIRLTASHVWGAGELASWLREKRAEKPVPGEIERPAMRRWATLSALGTGPAVQRLEGRNALSRG
jgi:hypothetical protein